MASGEAGPSGMVDVAALWQITGVPAELADGDSRFGEAARMLYAAALVDFGDQEPLVTWMMCRAYQAGRDDGYEAGRAFGRTAC